MHSLGLEPGGDILIGGGFTTVNGVPRSRVARLHAAPRPPEEIVLSHQQVYAGNPTGTIVGYLSAADFDESETHAFSFLPGDGDEGNALFYIDGDQLRTGAFFDTDEQGSYTIRIRAANTMGPWIKQTFTLTVVPDPYLAWAEALPEGQRAPTDDPGGFGIANRLRYAFGMDALQPEREKLPRIGHRLKLSKRASRKRI